MSKAKMRRKIARLERSLFAARQAAFSEALRPLTFNTGTVVLGSTGGPTTAIQFPVYGDQRPPTIDLPAMGYTVTYRGPAEPRA